MAKFVNVLAFIVSISLLASASGDSFVLYDADPDSNAATPAPDPTTMGWIVGNLDNPGGTAALWANPGTTTGGAQAWVLDDAGPTGNTTTGNQSAILAYLLSPQVLDEMDSGGFTLTMNFEQLSDGAFVGLGYNHDGADDDIGLTGDTRYGQSPAGGLQSFTYSWDGTTFTPNAGAGGPNGFSAFWGNATDGGGQIFFGDNTRNTSAFNLAITSVTLSGDDIVSIPEPTSIALFGFGFGAIALLRRRR